MDIGAEESFRRRPMRRGLTWVGREESQCARGVGLMEELGEVGFGRIGRGEDHERAIWMERRRMVGTAVETVKWDQ